MLRVRKIRNRLIAFPMSNIVLLSLLFFFTHLIGQRAAAYDGVVLAILTVIGVFVLITVLVSYLLYRITYTALLNDAKKRIAAEYYFAESEANLARVQQLTHTGNFKYQLSSGRLRVSRELLRILGIRKKNSSRVVPLTVMRHVSPEVRQQITRKVRECVRDKKRDTLEIAVTVAGVSRRLSLIFDLGFARDKKTPHLFGTVQDVSEQVAAEQNTKQIQGALYQSAKMASLGLMSASIVHELKNPLTAVLGYAELLHTQPAGTGAHAKITEKLLHAAGRMKAVVDHLRTYCREDKEEDWVPIQPNGAIMGALQFLQHLAKREDISYELTLQADLPVIRGSAILLESVFQNLVVNSIDAYAELQQRAERMIKVTSLLQGGKVVIIYEDNAGGMSKEVVDKIFETFFTTKPAGKGTGLGMAITQNIIKEHGGTIKVESESGSGTRFTITLPPYAKEKIKPVATRAA